jgi:hypothetical protein
MFAKSCAACDEDFASLTQHHFPIIAAALAAFVCADVVSLVAMLFSL